MLQVQGEEAEQHLIAQMAGQGRAWPAAARRGLHTVMRSRVGPEQRQAVLHVAAALAQLGRHAWLLPRQAYPVPCKGLTICPPPPSLLHASEKVPQHLTESTQSSAVLWDVVANGLFGLSMEGQDPCRPCRLWMLGS